MLLELAKIRDEVEIVGDVRGKGLMIGVEMVTDKVTMLMSNLSQLYFFVNSRNGSKGCFLPFGPKCS